MSKTIPLPSEKGEPFWEIAELFPCQGAWQESDYFALDTNWFVEFDDGVIEIQRPFDYGNRMIAGWLLMHLSSYIQQAHYEGWVLPGAFPIKLRTNRFVMPDIVFLVAEHDDRRHEQYWDGADLVVEVVSPDSPQRDTVQKRKEYAEAGIPEYWIVNPLDETVTVLTLAEDVYAEHGIFGRGEEAASVLLDGFVADVSAVFDAPQ